MARHLWKSPLNANDTTQNDDLGILREEVDRDIGTGYGTVKEYLYVQYYQGSAAIPASLGNILCFVGTTPYMVTKDISDSNDSRVAGVAIGTLNHERFGWLQVGGICQSIITDGAVAVGNFISPSATDGVATTPAVASNTGRNFGVALDTDSGTVLGNAMLFLA